MNVSVVELHGWFLMFLMYVFCIIFNVVHAVFTIAYLYVPLYAVHRK